MFRKEHFLRHNAESEEGDFHGEKRKNQTPGSTTDPDARLFRKSKGSEAKLGYLGHVLMENRNRLLLQTFLSEANGRAERDAAMLMAETIPGGKRVRHALLVSASCS